MIDRITYLIYLFPMSTTPRPKEPHLLRLWVRYKLGVKGITFASLAKQHNCRRDLISRPFLQHSPKWEKVIADAMLMIPEELWPERYPEKCTSKGQQNNGKCTRKTAGKQ